MVLVPGIAFTETEDKVVCTCSFDTYAYPSNLLYLNIQSLFYNLLVITQPSGICELFKVFHEASFTADLVASFPKYCCCCCYHHNLWKVHGTLASLLGPFTDIVFFDPHPSFVRYIKLGLTSSYQGKSQVHWDHLLAPPSSPSFIGQLIPHSNLPATFLLWINLLCVKIRLGYSLA